MSHAERSGADPADLSAMPHKRRRRTKADVAAIRDEMVRLALELRQSGAISWESIVDRTRWFFGASTYDSLADALEASSHIYRRSLWTGSLRQVQVWCESMSVAGVIMGVTKKWDVRLFPGKGYSSHDFLRTAARDLAKDGRDVTIFLLGDYDPSGRDILRFVEKMLREYAAEVDDSVVIDFTHLAVTPEQVARWDLPSHPTKRSDSRQGRYPMERAVELEAIPPDRLRGLVVEAITAMIDPGELQRLQDVEEGERETLQFIAKAYRHSKGKGDDGSEQP